jgi:low temperature requirement protein LtrA
MAISALLRPPTLRTGDRERTSSWLELFFDLVFVIAVTQLGVALAADLSVHGFLRAAVLFVPVWWAWVGFTNYADRFDSDDVFFRLVVLGAMLGMLVVAVVIPSTFGGGLSATFALAYAAVRCLLIVLYLRARRHVPAARSLCDVTISVFVIGTSFWLVSVVVAEPVRFALWGLALLIEGSTPWLARRAMAGVPYHAEHLPERYGLFTLIVLGESLVAVVTGVHTANWQPASVVTAGLGFAGTAALWWLYFDGVDRAAVRRNLLSRNVFIYSHAAIAAGLVVSSVGVKEAASHAAAGALPDGARWALVAGPAVVLLGLAAIRLAAGRHDRMVAVQCGAAALLVLLGLLTGRAPVAGTAGAVVAVLAVAVVLGLVWSPQTDEPTTVGDA